MEKKYKLREDLKKNIMAKHYIVLKPLGTLKL